MIYRVKFNNPVELDKFEDLEDSSGFFLDITSNIYTGNDSVEFNGVRIDLVYDENSMVNEIFICNECTKSFNAEEELLLLTHQLISGTETTVQLIDEKNSAEECDADDLAGMIETF
ncbi:MAG: hypothetical protein K9J16_11400 [Melioribacteraceae bacterium]|nr:hypothetical protein [Melioribacteraceae bacterium]MCF8353616.1 hypothetical protein [Melioribacteraceae bacterium]MCF8393539.1 hypothetical protein [Melioribacteraceae bacterium]MCF8419349.1 hypothetical protein [Melioribacteraceae bacterium]